MDVEGCDSLEKAYVVFGMKLLKLSRCGSAREVHVHGIVHAVCEDDLVCECKTPWLHRMREPKVLLLSLGIDVVGDRVAFGSFDAIFNSFMKNSLIECICFCGAICGILIFLDDTGSRHDGTAWRATRREMKDLLL